MSVIADVERWGNSHRPGFLDLFRIALGLFITYKGLFFITHMNELENTTAGINTWFAGAFLAHYVIFAHILAGPLIELAPDFAKALAPGGTVILAGLLDTQAKAVAGAYEALGLTLKERGSGEWPVLVLQAA